MVPRQMLAEEPIRGHGERATPWQTEALWAPTGHGPIEVHGGLFSLRATAGGKLEISHSGEKLGVGEKGMENETYVHVSSQNRSTVFLFALCS